MYIKTNGKWQLVRFPFIKQSNGSWAEIKSAWIKRNGDYQLCFQGRNSWRVECDAYPGESSTVGVTSTVWNTDVGEASSAGTQTPASQSTIKYWGWQTLATWWQILEGEPINPGTLPSGERRIQVLFKDGVVQRNSLTPAETEKYYEIQNITAIEFLNLATGRRDTVTLWLLDISYNYIGEISRFIWVGDKAINLSSVNDYYVRFIQEGSPP